MGRLIDADALLEAYDAQHEGQPGRARKLIEDAPTIDVASLGMIAVKPLAEMLGSYCVAPGFTGFGTKDNRRAWEFFLLTTDWSEKDEAD